jgi:MtN3 and saliva related transmembrane protein
MPPISGSKGGERPSGQTPSLALGNASRPGALQSAMAELIANVVGTAAGLCGMVGFVPQIAKIVRDKDASSVSLKMYAVATTGFVLWTAYGLLLKSWPITGANAVMLVLAATILTLKIRYR